MVQQLQVVGEEKAGVRCAQGGVVVKVGDFVELSPVPGEELNRLVQVAALWSEPTQARQCMLASCHRFYRASVRSMLLLMHLRYSFGLCLHLRLNAMSNYWSCYIARALVTGLTHACGPWVC